MIDKRRLDDLAIFGGDPPFGEALHVGRPNIGDLGRLLGRSNQIPDSKRLTNNGPLVQELEHTISEMIGVRHCNRRVQRHGQAGDSRPGGRTLWRSDRPFVHLCRHGPCPPVARYRTWGNFAVVSAKTAHPELEALYRDPTPIHCGKVMPNSSGRFDWRVKTTSRSPLRRRPLDGRAKRWQGRTW